MRYVRPTTLLAAGAALLLVGCGDDVTDAVEELTDAIQEDLPDEAVPEDLEPPATDDDAGDAPSSEAVDIDPRSIDVTVHHGGLEYTVEELAIVDVDEVHGTELVFATSVFNPASSSATPAPPIALRWDEPGTDNVVEVNGRGEFRQIPGNSSSSGEIIVPLRPDDLEVFDDRSARLLIGASGRSAAQVAVGGEAVTIDRLPVQQPLEDETFDVDGVVVTITEAEVRWDNPNGSHVDDGTALLELTYRIENQSDSQSCSTRGEGAFNLTLPDGDAIIDLGVSERCVRGDQTETDVLTGFLIDEDYAGDYTLVHERGDDADEISFTLVEGEGARADERDTR